jgi:hypothetical protein
MTTSVPCSDTKALPICLSQVVMAIGNVALPSPAMKSRRISLRDFAKLPVVSAGSNGRAIEGKAHGLLKGSTNLRQLQIVSVSISRARDQNRF